MGPMTKAQEDYCAYFRFLDQLRQSGENMYGAPPILAEEFGITPEAARAAWKHWTETFREGASVEERVRMIGAQ
jgi:hypothetical protein